jgi:hypothetical protein
MKSLQKTSQEESQLQNLKYRTSIDFLIHQTPETILSNPELVTVRSLSHLNVTDEQRETMKHYKIMMTASLIDALGYVKTAIDFTKEMCIEFVNTFCYEFPNWKPEDFYLFCRNVKQGKYKSEFNHSIDYPTLFSWLHRYDYEKLQAIEARRSTETYVESTQIERTGESVEEVLKSFYDQIKARKKQYVPEPISDEEKEVQRRFTEWRKKKSEFLVTLKDMDVFKAEELRREWERSNPFE